MTKEAAAAELSLPLSLSMRRGNEENADVGLNSVKKQMIASNTETEYQKRAFMQLLSLVPLQKCMTGTVEKQLQNFTLGSDWLFQPIMQI